MTGAVVAVKSPRFVPVDDQGAPEIASAAFTSAADSTLIATVATAALTAGAFTVVVEYIEFA